MQSITAPEDGNNDSATQKTYEQMLASYRAPENGRCDVYWVSTEVIARLRPE